MTPEKIYLNKHPFTGELHDKWLLNKWDDSDIEYIRKDAFIEKALEWIRKEIRPYYYDVRYKYEDFKKAMEE